MSDILDITIPEHPIRREHIIAEELEGMDEVIFIDPETGDNFAMNHMAAVVLDLCDGKHSAQDIIQIIHEALSGDMERIDKDVHAILSEFVAFKLIHA
jgi:hypothetical protein